MNRRYTVKGKRIAGLIDRGDKALEQNFYIEASTIYYAIMEERLHSTFEKFNIHLTKKQKMYYCLTELKKFKSEGKTIVYENGMQIDLGPLINKHFSDNLLEDMNKWRSQRNSIIHDYAKTDIEYTDIKPWADRGKELLREFNSRVMTLKKDLKKLNAPL